MQANQYKQKDIIQGLESGLTPYELEQAEMYRCCFFILRALVSSVYCNACAKSKCLSWYCYPTVPDTLRRTSRSRASSCNKCAPKGFLPIISLRSLISPRHVAMGPRDGHGFNGSHTTTGRRPMSKGARDGTPAEGWKGRKWAHAARYACASFYSLCIPRVHIHAAQTFLTRLLCRRQRDELRVTSGYHVEFLPFL